MPFWAALALLARAAQGSMRDTLSLTTTIAQGGNQVLASVVTDMLGLMDKNQLLKVVHVVSTSPADVLQLVNDIAEQAPIMTTYTAIGCAAQITLTQWVPEACKLETTSAKAIFQLAKTIPAGNGCFIDCTAEEKTYRLLRMEKVRLK